MTRYAGQGAVGRRRTEAEVEKAFKLSALKTALKGKKAVQEPGRMQHEYQSVTNVRPGGRMYGNVQGIGKGIARQSVQPRLARRVALAGTGGRRVLTGDPVNARRVVGKADVEKFAGQSVLSAFRGGAAAGRAGMKPSAILPSSRLSALTPMGMKAMGAGQKAGAGYSAGLSAVKTNPGKIGLGVGGTGGMLLGGSMARRSDVGKRRYDPEDERRHRQGLEAGLMGAGGAGASAYAGRDIVRETRGRKAAYPALKPGRAPVRDDGRWLDPKTKKLRLATQQEVHGMDMAYDIKRAKHAEKVKAYARLRKPSGAVVRGRAAAAGAGGLALMGAAAGHHMRRNERRWE